MNEQYPKLVFDSRIARRRLAQAFQPEMDSQIKRWDLAATDRTLAVPRQKDGGDGDSFIRDLVRLVISFVHRIRSRTSETRSESGKHASWRSVRAGSLQRESNY